MKCEMTVMNENICCVVDVVILRTKNSIFSGANEKSKQETKNKLKSDQIKLKPTNCETSDRTFKNW